MFWLYIPLCFSFFYALAHQCVLHDGVPVVRIVDGDTLVIDAPWLPHGLGQTLRMRLLGIDTPEISRAECENERAHGIHAKQFVESVLQCNDESRIAYCGWDKYGRVLGDVVWPERQTNLTSQLLESGHAVSYDGTSRKPSWEHLCK